MSGICSFQGCNRPEFRSDLCQSHRKQRQRGEELRPLRVTRRAAGLICEFPDCGNPMYARGLCRKHHDQLIRGVELHGLSPAAVTAFKRKQQRQSWAQMPEEDKRHRVRGLLEGGRYERSEEWCRRMSEAKRGKKVHHFKTSERACIGCGMQFSLRSGRQIWCTISCREAHRRAVTYGMTLGDLEAIEERQGRECAICERPDVLVVDHDHVTGRVRGLLCVTCNTGIGKLGDSPERLRKALDYLEAVPV